MLSKKFRLTRSQINLLYKKGRSKNFGFLGLKFLPNGLPLSRFAVVIPQAVVKKVVQRNRLRRLIFEEIGTLSPAGLDYLVRLYHLPPDEKTLRQKVQEAFKSG